MGGPSIGDSLKDLITQNSTIRSIALRANKLGDRQGLGWRAPPPPPAPVKGPLGLGWWCGVVGMVFNVSMLQLHHTIQMVSLAFSLGEIFFETVPLERIHYADRATDPVETRLWRQTLWTGRGVQTPPTTVTGSF